jgi:hypothetical protein
VNAAANVCEEFVTTTQVDVQVSSVDAAADTLSLTGDRLELVTGDKVQVSTDGTLPGGLAALTDYYLIVDRPKAFTNTHPTYHQALFIEVRLAASYGDALSRTPVDITSAGTGTHTVSKIAEPRYACDGVIETSRRHLDVLDEIRASMAGRIVHAGGQWRVLAGAYQAPTLTYDENDLIAPLGVQTKHPVRSRFNAVKGIYVSPINDDQASDYPPVTNATYETQDNGRRMFHELDLPFTKRPHMAQRLAKIELERHRQQFSATGTFSLAAMQFQAADVVNLDNTRMGWSGKPFEVAAWRLSSTDVNGAPTLVVEATLRETASGVFDWASGEETAVDLAPNTSLPDPFTVQPPTALVITEELYQGRAGAGVKTRAVVTWTASADGFAESTQVEYKLASESTYTVLAKTTGASVEINDLLPGTYDFRAKAFNYVGVASSYVSKTQELLGLLAPPAAPQNLTISAIGGLAILRWDQSPDLDVRVGGKIAFRHSKAMTGATWQNSASIGEAVAGSETVAVLPLKAGTYLTKAVDSSGVPSLAATSISTKQATALDYTSVSTLSEHPSFPGTHSGTVAVDSLLKLGGGTNIDAWGAVDGIADWDSEGGVGSPGTYTFDGAFDFGSVVRRRLTSEITVAVANTLDAIDSRTASIDDWEDFDGNAAASGDVQVWTRETDDDPAGAPTWGAWQRLDSAEYQARAFEFQARLSADDPAYNVHVSELTVNADRVT